jgi:hypothetical protein
MGIERYHCHTPPEPAASSNSGGGGLLVMASTTVRAKSLGVVVQLG